MKKIAKIRVKTNEIETEKDNLEISIKLRVGFLKNINKIDKARL